MAIVYTIMFVICYRNVISESRITALRNQIHDHKKNHINNNNDNNHNNNDNNITTQNIRTFFDYFPQHNILKATVMHCVFMHIMLLQNQDIHNKNKKRFIVCILYYM